MFTTLQINVPGSDPEHDLLTVVKWVRNAPVGSCSLENLFHHVMLLLGLHAYTFNKNGNAELHTTSKSSAWMVVKKALEEAAQGAGSKLQLHPDVMSNSMLSRLAMERDNPGRSESVVSAWTSGKGIRLGNLNAMAKAVLIGHAPKQGETTGPVTSVDLLLGVAMVQIDIEAALKSTQASMHGNTRTMLPGSK